MYSNFVTKYCQKINKVLLFTILVTGSVIFSNTISSANAMTPLNPKIEPVEHSSSNPNLYVSAENSFYVNTFQP
ncbi:MAG: hypothetical protein KGI28_00360 [Thaumarchaeota archaeon]|nr:hypothetical protein [Nitrososphaerota archaeon]